MKLSNLDQYTVLGHLGLGFTEIRIPGKTQLFVSDINNFRDKVVKLSGGKCYVSINPRGIESGKNTDVSYLTCIVIDIDPIRESGTASSDEAHQEAIDQGIKISAKFHNAILADSGNGCHVYIPIQAIQITDDNRNELSERITLWMKSIRTEYQTKTLNIDNIHDFARVIRAWGSINEKSNRVCKIIKESENPYYRADLSEIIPLLPNITVTKSEDNPEYRKRFDKLLKNNQRLSSIYTGSGDFNSRSEADYCVIVQLAKAHFSTTEALELGRLNPLGSGKELRLDEVENAYSKINKEVTGGMSNKNYFKELKDRKPGIMTGFNQLDQKMAGLKNGRLYIIAARPTDGKTTFLTQLASNTASTGHKVLFFPTEVGHSAIYDKLLSRKSGVNLRKFQFGSFTSDELSAIQKAKESIEKSNVIVSENSALTIDYVDSKIREVTPDIVILDYLQRMKFKDGGTSNELSNAVIECKNMAEKYSVPFILASQLSRSAEENPASFSQLKGTGALEEAGDVVLFINTLDKTSYPRPVNFNFMKNKYGEPGIVKMKFWASTCNFEETE